MVQSGFLYILLNQSLGKLLKIGKTTRSPDERAKELSAATGVPTAFFVAYQEAVSDCDAAERYVHALLGQKGFRVAENREFFDVPLKDAILALQEASQIFGVSAAPTNLNTIDIVNSTDYENKPAWEAVFDLAEDAYYGTNTTLINYKEALRFYKQAADLGARNAYARIAEMYRDGEGVKEKIDLAIEYYQRGVKAGDIMCLPRLAGIYSWHAPELEEQCWSLFLTHIKEKIITEGVQGSWKELYGTHLLSYLESCYRRNVQVDDQIPFVEFKDVILQSLEFSLELQRKFSLEMPSTSSLVDEYYQMREQDRRNRVNYVKHHIGLIDISDKQVINSQIKGNRFTSLIKRLLNKT